MLTTTQPADLTAEIRAIMEKVNYLIDEATYVANETHLKLFEGEGVTYELGKMPIPKEADGMPGPVETALGYLDDVKRITARGAELESIGGEVWARLERITDLLS